MSQQKKKILQYVILAICVTLAASAQAFSIKGNIGVFACWDAVSLNVYELTGIKVGTFSIISNICCVILQLCILRREFKPIRLLQVPLAFAYGSIINLVYYHVLTFEVRGYAMRFLFLMISIVGLAIFLGIVTLMNLIPFPLEGTCYLLSNRYAWDFAKIRVGVDAGCMVVSIVISIVFGLSFKIREGTVIAMFLLGNLMKLCMKYEKPWLDKIMQ